MCLFFLAIILLFGTLIRSLHNQTFGFDELTCDTKCPKGEIKIGAECVIKGYVNFTQENASVRYSNVYIEYSKIGISNSDFTTLFSLRNESRCAKQSQEKKRGFDCKRQGRSSFEVIFYFKATPETIGTSVIGVLNKDAEKMTRSIQIEKYFYDAKNITGFVKINGAPKLLDDGCKAFIPVQDFKLEFNCLSQTTPCVIEILTNDSKNGQTFNNTAELYRTFGDKEIILVTIKFAACSLDGEYNIISCIIQADFKDNIYSKVIVVISASSVISLTIIVLLVVYIVRIHRLYKEEAMQKELMTKELGTIRTESKNISTTDAKESSDDEAMIVNGTDESQL